MMRLMIMFDLPVDTAVDRKQYRQFRKNLINEGFVMIQYSVYVRVCASKKGSRTLGKENKRICSRVWCHSKLNADRKAI